MKKHLFYVLILGLLAMTVLSACQSAKPTPAPQSTPIPPAQTARPNPTPTPASSTLDKPLRASTPGTASGAPIASSTPPSVQTARPNPAAQPAQTAKPSPTTQPTQETKKTETPAASQKAEQFGRPITEPLKATVSTQAVALGDLGKHQVQVAIPAGTLASGAVVTVVNPEKAPPMDSKTAISLGAPVSISIGDKPVRLKHLTTVILGIDKKSIPPGTDPAAIRVAYYNGKEWEYSKPDKVDLQTGSLTFTTDHFSLFQATKVDIKTRIAEKIHSETLADMAQEKLDDTVDKLAEQAIDHVLKDRLGIAEESKKFKVLSSLLKDDEYKDLYDNYKGGDVTKFIQTLNVFIGKKVAENVEDSELSSALGRLSKTALGSVSSKEGVAYVESVSQAAAYVAEGNYRGAGEIIGGKIADEFLIYKAAKVSKELIQYRIDVWRDNKMEAAFKAFKNGASKTTAGGFDKGYDVDAGDFEGVWNQMVALQERLQHEAVEKEKALRRDLRLNPLTPAEEAKLRANVKTDMEKEFKKRRDTELEAEKREAELKKLVDAFEAKGLLDKGTGGFRWATRPAEGELESRIDELLRCRDRIIRDTRNNPKGRKLTNDDIVTLTAALLSGSPAESKKLYTKFLGDMFGVIPPPLQPVAKITPSPFSGETNKDYTFTVAVSPPVDKARYDWIVYVLNGKQLQSGASNSVKVSFPSEGDFAVSLRVFDGSGKEQVKTSAAVTIKKTVPIAVTVEGFIKDPRNTFIGTPDNPVGVRLKGSIKGDPNLKFEGTEFYSEYGGRPRVLAFVYSIPANSTNSKLDFDGLVIEGIAPLKTSLKIPGAKPEDGIKEYTYKGWSGYIWTKGPLKNEAPNVSYDWIASKPLICNGCVVLDPNRNGEGTPWQQAGGVLFGFKYSTEYVQTGGNFQTASPLPDSHYPTIVIRLVKR